MLIFQIIAGLVLFMILWSLIAQVADGNKGWQGALAWLIIIVVALGTGFLALA